MPVKKKRSIPTGPIAAGVVAVLIVLGLVWFFFMRPKPTVVATDSPAKTETPSPTAKPAAPPAQAAPAATSSNPGGLSERVARLEAFFPPDVEPTEDLLTRLDRLERRVEQLQAQINSNRTPSTVINEWKVSAQKAGDPPAVSNDFLITRPVWRVACRVVRGSREPGEVMVRVFLRQEPERVVAEIPANSSLEIRSPPGVYFFRVTAVDADAVLAWESQ